MSTCTLRGIPISFPFEPYEIQKTYMEKVIECIQDKKNGILESPTGTGKTLSLLCSSLAWLTANKAQFQTRLCGVDTQDDQFFQMLQDDLNKKVGKAAQDKPAFLRPPQIIYASRTHSQLSQAMQELKRTAYSHVKACVIGSRDQLCIHPEIIQETQNQNKILLCRLKVLTRSCQFYNRVDAQKDSAVMQNLTVVDIEDLVRIGEKLRFCPYYMSKELKSTADIIFMPYNYLLDVKARKALGVEVANSIIIIDEAHNIERVCEESASHDISSTDIALCIDEITEVMKIMNNESVDFDTDVPKDFTAEDLCFIKQILLDFEVALDNIEIKSEGKTFDGDFLYRMLADAGVVYDNSTTVVGIMDKITQFLATVNDGAFQRKGTGLGLFQNLLEIVFMGCGPEFEEKIRKCYKVHLIIEENTQFGKRKTGSDWLSKATATSAKKNRILHYWCFSPGFSMNLLMRHGVRSIILTSGTLAPLKPLISELELDIQVQLENDHIVKGNQVCVKIVSKGPDMIELNCNYQNRDNPKYISSLGGTVMNLTRIVPHGMLVFFPSYPIMQKCQQQWQSEGTWSAISNIKPIFVEPKQKDAFNSAMSEYYKKIQDPNFKGAIFMGVCRGKVSEGLDFADMNGRAVVVIGLPYPPLKDPKIVLKRSYLDRRHAIDKDFLNGGEWYSLEATRAVNQAIGRVIRHQHDFGAIILLDSRFTSYKIKSQMSAWLRNYVKHINNFGEIVRDLRSFFRNAELTLPSPTLKSWGKENRDVNTPESSTSCNTKGSFDFSNTYYSSTNSQETGLVTLHKKEPTNQTNIKRRKITIVPVSPEETITVPKPTKVEYITMVRNVLNDDDFLAFSTALAIYRDVSDFEQLIAALDKIFLVKYSARYIIQGLEPYIRSTHKSDFEQYWKKMRV